MKKSFIGILAATIILSGCGTSQMAVGDPNAVLVGAAIGSNVGGAIGGLIGDSNGGWRGGYRGSAIGTIIGTIAGAAIANAATAPKKQEEYSYRIERTQPYPPQSGRQPQASAIDHLRIRNIRFIDDSRNHVINSGENCKVIFEIMNEGNKTAYNVVPVVVETTGMKRIYISPSVMIEQITPRNGVKYTANISAGERIKTGNVTIRIAIADEYGDEYDWQEFSFAHTTVEQCLNSSFSKKWNNSNLLSKKKNA